MNEVYAPAFENIQKSKYEDSRRFPNSRKLRLSNKYSKNAYFHNYITNKSVWTYKKVINCEKHTSKKKYCKFQRNKSHKRRQRNSIFVNSCSSTNIVNPLTDSNNASTIDHVVSKINKKQSHNNDFKDIDNNLLYKCKIEEYNRSFCDTLISPHLQFCKNKQNNFTYFPFTTYSTKNISPSFNLCKFNADKSGHTFRDYSNRNNRTTALSTATNNSSVEAWLESLSNENMSILSGNEIIEQMDWEISHEDRIVVSDIKHLRTQINKSLFSNFKSPNIESSNDTFERCNLFIVIDTNILISHLSFIDELLNCSFPGYDKFCVIIPWIVIQELDLLKNSRGISQDQKLLSVKAKQAISFLYGNFSSGHPRLRGQSTVEFCQSETFLSQGNDDSIIQCCLQMASHSSSVLLSNDKTLCTKAIMLGLCAMTKERLQKEIEKCSHKNISTEMLNSDSDMPIICANNHSIEKIQFSFTEILKEVVSQVIEVEMQLAYGELWSLVLKIKPPWTCLSTLKLIDLHWIAVFGLILPHKVKLLCNILLEKLKNNFYLQNKPEELKEIFICLQELLNLLGKRSCYDGVLQAAEKSLKSLYIYYSVAQNSINESLQEIPNESEILSVYTALELIWKYMTDMCHQVFNSINTSYVGDSFPQQKCLQILPHLCKACHNFCILFSQILCTNPNELSSNHILVTELTSVLIGFFPSIDEQYIHNEILIHPKQVSQFCMDFKSRSMLNVAMQKLRSLKLEIISCYKKLKSGEM